jgi:hypothetical protein
MKYELGFYIREDGILHSHCREHPKPYTIPDDWKGASIVVWCSEDTREGHRRLNHDVNAVQPR